MLEFSKIRATKAGRHPSNIEKELCSWNDFTLVYLGD
jgi:hypothetical protein